MQIEVSNGEIVDKYTILQIKADKIMILNKSLIKKKIGTINDIIFEKVKQEIFKMF